MLVGAAATALWAWQAVVTADSRAAAATHEAAVEATLTAIVEPTDAELTE
jgi:hypothetical protein